MRACVDLAHVVSARSLARVSAFVSSDWGLDTLAGRFVELGGGASTATLTLCAGLILEAQRRGRLALWIGKRSCSFFPPDFAASGIDLEALPVIHVNTAAEVCRAADTLLRSGAFALAVLDLGSERRLSLAVQTRLGGLAKTYGASIVAVTQQARNEVHGGSLVSLRGETEKQRLEHNCFRCELRIVKDKRGVPGWRHAELCCGPDGLC